MQIFLPVGERVIHLLKWFWSGLTLYYVFTRLDTGERHENADPADMDIGQDNQNDMYNR